MMHWLNKYRMSRALDSSVRRSARLQREIGRSGDLRRFDEELTCVDRLLKEQSPPAAEAPVYFHGSIARAIRACATSSAAESPRRIRWVPALGVSLIALAGFLWALAQHPQQVEGNSVPFQPAARALEMGSELAQKAPGSLAQPMSDEWERINQDFERTADFLMSSVP